MSELEKVLYSPALRMKQGELNGVRELASDVSAFVIPRFIVPPIGERNDSNQTDLFPPGKTPDVGAILAKYWQGRRSFVDLTYLIDEAGRDSIGLWLPEIFKRARSLKSRPIPMAMLSDITAHEAVGFKAAIALDDSLKFAICVPSGEMVRADFGNDINAVLSLLGLTSRDCAIIADFSDSDLSQPDNVAPVIGGALEQLQDIGKWQHIIFQATYYPEKNPAEPGNSVLWPRNEWLAWCQAVKFDPNTAEYMIFGDYAADSAKMVFGGKGGRPIRHYRYTVENAWLVERGQESGTDKEIMRDVCSRIVNSRCFSGPRFSTADLYIHRSANDLDGPGNSATWRQVNTTHHVTKVVKDVATVRSISIAEIADEPEAEQLSLLV
jgi:hypothetical protein